LFLGIVFGFASMLISIFVMFHMFYHNIKELPLFDKGEKVESAQVINRYLQYLLHNY